MKKRTKLSKKVARLNVEKTDLVKSEMQNYSSSMVPAVYPKTNEETDKKISKKIMKWSKEDSRNHFMTPLWLTVFLKFIYPIELDAASSEEVNSIHGFKRYYSKKENALLQEWQVENGQGIFINPPYCEENSLHEWAIKITEQHKNHGHLIFVLIPARSTETRWFQLLLKQASHVIFLKKRLIHNEFISQTPANFPSALVVFSGWKIGQNLKFLSLLGELLETETYRKTREAGLQLTLTD
jgi:site-specific DNA-methyltransferase (adenine-specific)